MRKLIFTAITYTFCLFFCMGLKAQYSESPEAFSIRYLMPNYQFQFANVLESNDFTNGFQVEYARHLSEAFNIAIPFQLAIADYPGETDRTNIKKGSYLGFDVLLQLKFFQKDQLINPSLYTGLGLNVENFDALNLNLPLGLQIDFRLDESVYISPRIEYRVGFTENRDNLMPALGMKLLLNGEIKPSIQDADQDGVPDAQDACPNQAGSLTSGGCPDSDGDGIPNQDDACPLAAGPASTQGCPDADGDGVGDHEDACPTLYGPKETKGCPVNDSDRDGVADEEDACPTIPGSVQFNGCPDTDGDGVGDHEDACPRVAGPQNTKGCPDTDGDGVPDKDDKCPSTYGTISNQGCPDLSPEEKASLNTAAKAIQFETASARLKPASLPFLNQIAALLQRYPDFRMSIDGHTDTIGNAMNNQSLSEKRAKSCYDYLIGRGIAAQRLEYRGYGETRPIADNRYQAGREQNRRVEFNIIN